MTININGQWKGVITYGPEYDELENSELYFSIDIKQTADTFTGVAHDTGGVGTNPDKALVNGFVEGNSINFTKQYQSTLIIEEDGTETVLRGKPAPEVHYWGTFDQLTNTLEGEWEISVYAEKFADGYFDDVFRGTWKASRH